MVYPKTPNMTLHSGHIVQMNTHNSKLLDCSMLSLSWVFKKRVKTGDMFALFLHMGQWSMQLTILIRNRSYFRAMCPCMHASISDESISSESVFINSFELSMIDIYFRLHIGHMQQVFNTGMWMKLEMNIVKSILLTHNYLKSISVKSQTPFKSSLYSNTAHKIVFEMCAG